MPSGHGSQATGKGGRSPSAGGWRPGTEDESAAGKTGAVLPAGGPPGEHRRVVAGSSCRRGDECCPPVWRVVCTSGPLIVCLHLPGRGGFLAISNLILG